MYIFFAVVVCFNLYFIYRLTFFSLNPLSLKVMTVVKRKKLGDLVMLFSPSFGERS